MSNQRRDDRYTIGDASLPVRIDRTVNGQPIAEQGEVLDISSSGVKLSVNQPFANDEQLGLRVHVEELALDVDVSANVRWTTIRDSDRWWVGCAFREELASQVLSKLASAGYLNRRQETRQEIELTTQARWSLTPGSFPVRLTNLSTGGFAILAPPRTQPSERLLLELASAHGEPLMIPAKVQWHSETSEGVQIGCQFLNRTGFGRLRGFLDTRLPETTPELRRRRFGMRPWFLIGWLVILLWVSLRNWLS